MKVFEGDYLDGRKVGFGILPSRILQYIDDNNIDEATILDALNKLMVVELYNAGMAKLFFKMGEYEDSFIADIGQTTDLIREYKIMNVSENIDRKDGKQQLVLIVDMARIERILFENDRGIVWTNTFKDYGFDRFIFPVKTLDAMNLLDNPSENKFIYFSKFIRRNILFDGKPQYAYFYSIESRLDEGFSKLNLTAKKMGDIENEEIHFDFLTKTIDGYYVYLTQNNFRVFNDFEMIIDTTLQLIENTSFTITYVGSYNDGRNFRLVTAGNITEQIMKARGELPIITLASMYPNGYAVTCSY